MYSRLNLHANKTLGRVYRARDAAAASLFAAAVYINARERARGGGMQARVAEGSQYDQALCFLQSTHNSSLRQVCANFRGYTRDAAAVVCRVLQEEMHVLDEATVERAVMVLSRVLAESGRGAEFAHFKKDICLILMCVMRNFRLNCNLNLGAMRLFASCGKWELQQYADEWRGGILDPASSTWDDGWLGIVVHCMQTFPGLQEIQECGCAILKRSYSSDPAYDRAAQTRASFWLCDLLERYAGNARMFVRVYSAMHNLAMNYSEAVPVEVQRVVTPHLVQWLRTSLTLPVQFSRKNVKNINRCTNLLTRATTMDPTRGDLVEAGCVSATMELVMHYSDFPHNERATYWLVDMMDKFSRFREFDHAFLAPRVLECVTDTIKNLYYGFVEYTPLCIRNSNARQYAEMRDSMFTCERCCHILANLTEPSNARKDPSLLDDRLSTERDAEVARVQHTIACQIHRMLDIFTIILIYEGNNRHEFHEVEFAVLLSIASLSRNNQDAARALVLHDKEILARRGVQLLELIIGLLANRTPEHPSLHEEFATLCVFENILMGFRATPDELHSAQMRALHPRILLAREGNTASRSTHRTEYNADEDEMRVQFAEDVDRKYASILAKLCGTFPEREAMPWLEITESGSMYVHDVEQFADKHDAQAPPAVRRTFHRVCS